MATFEFIDNGSSSITIVKNGLSTTLAKNTLDLVINTDSPDILLIESFATLGGISNRVTPSTDTIIGIGAGSTTPTELRDALEPIFFLGNSVPLSVLSRPIDIFNNVISFNDPPIEVTTTT